MAQNADTLIRFLLPEAQCRGVIIRGNHIIRDAQGIHGLNHEPALLFGQSLLASILLLSISKGGVRQVLQLDSTDTHMPIQRILAECRRGAVRGYIQWQEEAQVQRQYAQQHITAWMGATLMISTVRDMGFGQPYVSTIEHQSDYLADHLVHYLQQSVQVRADIILEGNLAIMIEAMPGCHDAAWFKALEALAAIPTTHLRQQSPRDILSALDALGMRIVGEDSYRYHCACNLKAMQQALKSMNPETLRELSDNQHDITLSCQYCQKHYTIPLEAS